MASAISGNRPDNAQVQHTLGLRVGRDILGAVGDVEISPLSTHNFSFTFSVKAGTPSGLRHVFVKIPKTDLRSRQPTILPITSGDRRMAQEEESSLRLLGEKWEGNDLQVYWVKLRGTIADDNAIVTDRVFADPGFSAFRRLDLLRRLGFRQKGQRLCRLMGRLGTAFGRFHQANAKATVFRLSKMIPKLEFYCQKLASATGSPWPERVLKMVRPMGGMEFESIEVPTLKGIDMRNVLIDAQDSLYLLDPGKTKLAPREAALARFMMTYRILYWGSNLLLLVRTPDPKAEESFLSAYYAGGESRGGRLLDLYLLKEQLKHWHTALDSLRLRAWSPAATRLAADIYVNPFYTRQIRAQFHAIAG